MYSEDFEVYYYSDLPLKAVSPHTHNYYEFYFFLEGNVDIHVEDKTYHIKNGDFLIIEFGHNDQKIDTLDAFGGYTENLKYFWIIQHHTAVSFFGSVPITVTASWSLH